MSQALNRLENMRNNPRDDWDIKDIELICNHFEVELTAPTGGSHYKVSHKSQINILTIPAKRKIKPFYIKEFLDFIDAVIRSCDFDGDP